MIIPNTFPEDAVEIISAFYGELSLADWKYGPVQRNGWLFRILEKVRVTYIVEICQNILRRDGGKRVSVTN